MTIAVITPVAGRTTHLARLLDGLATQRRHPDEIVVVDLAPHDPAVRDCTAGWTAVRRLPLHPDASGALRLAAARNLGAASTDCDLLVFLDADCIPAGDLIASYEDGLRRRPHALVCGPVRYLRQQWLESCGDPADDRRLDALSDAPSARPHPVALTDGDDHELFWSLSFGVTSSTWTAIGGFDPAYVGYGAEDTDFAMRARARGVRLAWIPDGVAYHQWHPPSRLEPGRLGELVANARRYRQRWGCWPMAGWLTELHQRGAICFVPDADVLDVHG
jgi:GT2 family glycosyltransferase